MSIVRIALANLPHPSSAAESVAIAEQSVRQAAEQGAAIVCFPESYVPGYQNERPGAEFLERAWASVAAAAGRARIAVILGTERVVEAGRRISALVIYPDGAIAGFQDKVQLDPSEEGTFSAGTERRVFQAGPLTFGIAICHEGWRYPETVRWAARRGAQVVFHPHFHDAGPTSFHEHAVLCRAAENTCYIATVNCARAGSPTTSAIARPDGALLAQQPHGKAGLLIADIDTAEATGLLAKRYKPLAPA